jgi:hypothetical protein
MDLQRAGFDWGEDEELLYSISQFVRRLITLMRCVSNHPHHPIPDNGILTIATIRIANGSVGCPTVI